MSRIKIAVVGATGRMGRMIIEAVLKDEAAELAAAIDLPGNPTIGKPSKPRPCLLPTLRGSWINNHDQIAKFLCRNAECSRPSE